MVTAAVFLTFLLFCIAWWFSASRRHRLASPEDIKAGLAPGHLDAIQPFAPADRRSLLEDDVEVYTSTGGRAGVHRRQANAALMVGFVQWLVIEKESDGAKNQLDCELRYMVERATVISICTNLAALESLGRWFLPSLPHLCSRIAAILYWEMAIRMNTICEEFMPEMKADFTLAL